MKISAYYHYIILAYTVNRPNTFFSRDGDRENIHQRRKRDMANLRANFGLFPELLLSSRCGTDRRTDGRTNRPGAKSVDNACALGHIFNDYQSNVDRRLVYTYLY